jgi:hypothetical protein
MREPRIRSADEYDPPRGRDHSDRALRLWFCETAAAIAKKNHGPDHPLHIEFRDKAAACRSVMEQDQEKAA